ncbi:hypothetical protein MBLNU230_g8259t1 [Neophaeotheca triangularis]
MSAIKQLSILGVRSFDNQRAETIQFHTPLTLIVGLNGSGKTTIIECLKFATTGSLPDMSKTGGAFIHDPKLCGEKEVLAQVKLQFTSVDGASMVVTRSMQLTAKKQTRSQKMLEGSLVMRKNGEKVTLSSRVAELNSVMPKYLGVSKAVLENVVFCHQEDSLWPLNAGSKLKDKFDDIFEAVKYTSAITNINELRKAQNNSLISLKKDEEHYKTDKARGERVHDEIIQLEALIEQKGKEKDKVTESMKNVARHCEEAFAQAASTGKIVGELNGKRIQRQTKEESVQSLREHLEEMEESDEQLASMLEQYEERVSVYERSVKQHTSDWQDLQSSANSAKSRINAKERECGSHEAEQASYERQVANREKLVKETARRHGIRGYDSDVDDKQVGSFIERITKMAKEQNAAFERARRETQEELQGAQNVLTQINEKKSASTQRKENARQTITNNDRKIGNLQNSLNQIEMDEGGRVSLEAKAKEVGARLNNAKGEAGKAEWDAKISASEAEIRSLEEQKEILDSELIEATKRAGDSAQLDYLQQELKDRQLKLETMQGAHGDQLSKVVGEWQPETLENKFQRAVDDSTASVRDAEKQMDGTSREDEQTHYKLKTCRAELEAKERSLKSAAQKIQDGAGCPPEEYHETVAELEEARDILSANLEYASAMRKYFTDCMKAADDNQACMTCKRGLKNAAATKDFKMEIQKQLDKWDEKKASSNIDEANSQFKSASLVNSQFDTWERLKEKEIPKLKKEDAELSSRKAELDRQLEDQEADINERKAIKRDVESISRTVQSIVKHSSEITKYEAQIQDLAQKQKQAGSSRGLEQIQDEIRKTADQIKTWRGQSNKATGERDRSRTQINSMELEVRDIRGKLDTAVYQLKERTSLETQIEEVKGYSDEQRQLVKSADQELQGFASQLAQAQTKYEDISRRGDEKDRELQAETSQINTSLNQLKMADQEVKSYIERDGPQQLEQGRNALEELKNELSGIEEEMGKISREVKQYQEKLRNVGDTKRSIQDNLRFRRDLAALQAVRQEIEELESHDAEADHARYEREGQRLQTERNKLSADQSKLAGEGGALDRQLMSKMEEWDKDYKDSARRYKEAHVKVETTKACIDDLGRYGGALDKAIMKYHSLKMEEINRIIEELWRKTYQGTDVDTIIIRSESETTKANKNYNYRVCMVKQDAEMDMRGRCSAGQKVLACIIIRLALAECFGVNCGLIALDEPTTNLDKDNIRALAQSLSDIIKLRRQQKNFQLLVITHDEDFLKQMQCNDFADVYYQVGRNKSQKSEIVQANVADVL